MFPPVSCVDVLLVFPLLTGRKTPRSRDLQDPKEFRPLRPPELDDVGTGRLPSALERVVGQGTVHEDGLERAGRATG
jgi:hypothetical protein